jgi:hypothetical protein
MMAENEELIAKGDARFVRRSTGNSCLKLKVRWAEQARRVTFVDLTFDACEKGEREREGNG